MTDHEKLPTTGQGPQRHLSTQRITTGAFLAALALALSWLESVIPFQPGLPGVKLGLPNLVIVFCMYRMDVRTAVTVNVVRILLAGLMFSGLWGMLYSLCGAACSMAIMILLLLSDRNVSHRKSQASGSSSAISSVKSGRNPRCIAQNKNASVPHPEDGPFSIIGISMAGGVFHNLGQLLIAMLAVSNVNLFFYCPVLIVSGMITGILNGIIALVLLRKLPNGLGNGNEA